MSTAALRVWPELQRSVIRPELYGLFAEHAGRGVYEGLWTGPCSKVPNESGMRLDVLAALKQLRTPLMRWPGGAFANTYHWRGGVGDPAARVPSLNASWGQVEPNTFGTAEFLECCALTGCKPWITVNTATGSPREALEWLEYCNYGCDTRFARLRAAHGHPAPHEAVHWTLGHTPWAGGGRMTPEEYGAECRRYATLLRAQDPAVHVTACLPVRHGNVAPEDWGHRLCAALGGPGAADSFALDGGLGGHACDPEDPMAAMAVLTALEREIESAEQLLAYWFPGRPVGIVVDGWGCRHPDATPDTGLEQPATLRDAVAAAAALNMFHRHSGRLVAASLAHAINAGHCLAQTNGDQLSLTPTYHVFDMMRHHMGTRLVTHELDCSACTVPRPDGGPGELVPALSVSATLGGRKVFLSVAHSRPEPATALRISMRETRIASVTGRVFGGSTEVVGGTRLPAPKRFRPAFEGNEIIVEIPPLSVTTLTVSLE
jgi:alpha-L-arabinofuranosidase